MCVLFARLWAGRDSASAHIKILFALCAPKFCVAPARARQPQSGIAPPFESPTHAKQFACSRHKILFVHFGGRGGTRTPVGARPPGLQPGAIAAMRPARNAKILYHNFYLRQRKRPAGAGLYMGGCFGINFPSCFESSDQSTSSVCDAPSVTLGTKMLP